MCGCVVTRNLTRDVPAELIFQLRAVGLPEPMREVMVDPSRRFRYDLAWPELKLAVECQGGVWSSGRHTRGQGYSDDCVKANLAVVNGWKLLRFTTEMVDDGSALTTIERVMND